MSTRLPKIISQEEAAALLAVPNVGCPTGLRNRVILEVMYRAGLRVSEVVKLKPGDIRRKTGELEIRNGKGGKDRVVPVDDETMSWLERWERARPKAGGRFFTTLQGGRLSTRYLGQMVDRCAEKAGLDRKRVSPHVLRHSYATEKLDAGFTIREVQELLGHANVSTTQIYTHVSPKSLREKVQGNGEAGEVQQLAEALAKLHREQRAALAEALSVGLIDNNGG